MIGWALDNGGYPNQNNLQFAKGRNWIFLAKTSTGDVQIFSNTKLHL
jgi:hypothetical protein